MRGRWAYKGKEEQGYMMEREIHGSWYEYNEQGNMICFWNPIIYYYTPVIFSII